MAKREDFKVGHAVAHITGGDGVVESTDGKAVRVRYQKKTADGRGNLTGIYDDNWFELHPKYLFHRSPQPNPEP